MKENITRFRSEIYNQLDNLNKWKAESFDESKNREKLVTLPHDLENINTLAEEIKTHHRDITKLMKMNDGVFERLGFTSPSYHDQQSLSVSGEIRPNIPVRNFGYNEIHTNQYNIEHVTNESQNLQSQQIQKQHNVELLVCIDSNRRYIDWRKFWTLKGTEKRFCGNLDELENFIRQENKIDTLKNILIHIGVNDLDQNEAEQVFEKIKSITTLVEEKYKDINIILSEITPRNDYLDTQVIKCNSLINEYYINKDRVFIAKHDNLRKEYFFMDNKHLTSNITPRFVSNLKIALRKAYGITKNDYNSSSLNRKTRNNDGIGNIEFSNKQRLMRNDDDKTTQHLNDFKADLLNKIADLINK